jgi:hypothetical protein
MHFEILLEKNVEFKWTGTGHSLLIRDPLQNKQKTCHKKTQKGNLFFHFYFDIETSLKLHLLG